MNGDALYNCPTQILSPNKVHDPVLSFDIYSKQSAVKQIKYKTNPFTILIAQPLSNSGIIYCRHYLY